MTAMLELRDIHKQWDHRPLLAGVDLRVDAGLGTILARDPRLAGDRVHPLPHAVAGDLLDVAYGSVHRVDHVLVDLDVETLDREDPT